MPCVKFGGAICCYSPAFRLRLGDGRYVFLEWHSYWGPTFYHDRWRSREIDEWFFDPYICTALKWFIKRGEKA